MEHYGNGKSPGLEQTVSESIQTGFTAADLEMHPDEKGVLKQLAKRVAGLAALRSRKAAPAGEKPSWLRTILKGAGLISTVWQVFRSQGRDRDGV